LSEDDAEYHKSARNMAAVLAAIVITIFAAIFIPPLINPLHDQFLPEVSVASPEGFTLYLGLRPVSPGSGMPVTVTIWMNNTGSQVDNATAESSWPMGGLFNNPCPTGEPLPFGVGILQGYYSSSNATQGLPLSLQTSDPCSAAGPSPAWFAIAPGSSQAIVPYTGSFQRWNLSSSFSPFTGFYPAGSTTLDRFQGVYTVVAADEWGDLVVSHFDAA
jgi:hypothetical protein